YKTRDLVKTRTNTNSISIHSFQSHTTSYDNTKAPSHLTNTPTYHISAAPLAVHLLSAPRNQNYRDKGETIQSMSITIACKPTK
ncbi:hypothetical protein U1Q18_000542, partial [Sarracenia purpurea var. burkii]